MCITPGALNDENPNDVIAPVDINAFHAAHAHAHEGALRKTAKQIGVTVKGGLHECKGCSMAKGISMPIPSKTPGQAVYALGGREELCLRKESRAKLVRRLH